MLSPELEVEARVAIARYFKESNMASTSTGTEKVPSSIPSTSSSASALGTARETSGKAARTGDRNREATEGPMMVASEFNMAFRKSLKDQPMATLAVAVGLGFILGAIWKT